MKIFSEMKVPVFVAPPSLAENGDTYIAKYIPVGYRIANADEIEARQVARQLKIPTDAAIRVAAPEMATLINNPCWLVPVPASNGSLAANLVLARAIAAF